MFAFLKDVRNVYLQIRCAFHKVALSWPNEESGVFFNRIEIYLHVEHLLIQYHYD